MNKEKVTKEILDIIWKCENIINSKPEDAEIVQKKIMAGVDLVDNSHCSSWLGYHSRIYYQDFQEIPAGAHFDVSWGFYRSSLNGTRGDWVEYDFAAVKNFIYDGISDKRENALIEACKNVDDSINAYSGAFGTLIRPYSAGDSGAIRHPL